jgi:hypothetical protein
MKGRSVRITEALLHNARQSSELQTTIAKQEKHFKIFIKHGLENNPFILDEARLVREAASRTYPGPMSVEEMFESLRALINRYDDLCDRANKLSERTNAMIQMVSLKKSISKYMELFSNLFIEVQSSFDS